MELTANALSASAKPVILACSPSRIVTHPPSGAIGREFLFSARVGHGAFTVDADKVILGPVLHGLITARKALALAEGDMTAYRTLHAATVAPRPRVRSGRVLACMCVDRGSSRGPGHQRRSAARASAVCSLIGAACVAPSFEAMEAFAT